MKTNMIRTTLVIGIAGVLAISGTIGSASLCITPLSVYASTAVATDSVRHVSNGVTFYFDSDVYGQLSFEEFDYMVLARMNQSNWIRADRTYRVHSLTQSQVRISEIGGNGSTALHRPRNWQSDTTATPVIPTVPLPKIQTTPAPELPVASVNPPVVGEDEAVQVLFDGLTLLTNDELLAWAEVAPSHEDTRSATTLTNRRLTDVELRAWIDEYQVLGGINAFELEVIRLINEFRAENELPPLAVSMELSMAARFHSQDMVDLDYLAHQSPVYGRPTDRARMFGHVNVQGGSGVSENAYRGGGNPERVVQVWMDSPGHRATMLCEDTLSIGIGSVTGRVTAKFGF